MSLVKLKDMKPGASVFVPHLDFEGVVSRITSLYVILLDSNNAKHTFSPEVQVMAKTQTRPQSFAIDKDTTDCFSISLLFHCLHVEVRPAINKDWSTAKVEDTSAVDGSSVSVSFEMQLAESSFEKRLELVKKAIAVYNFEKEIKGE